MFLSIPDVVELRQKIARRGPNERVVCDYEHLIQHNWERYPWRATQMFWDDVHNEREWHGSSDTG